MAAMRRIRYVNLADQHRPLKAELLEAVARVIDSGQFILGDEVSTFEARFAELCGVRHAVGVGNGTDALVMTLRALEVGPGDEVVTAANSFVSSASCAALVGATPVLVDVGEDLNIDPRAVERAITPRTKALIPVHLTGRPADMDALQDIARRKGLFIIEDCAQAVLAEYKGRRVGSLGTAGCFSLHPLKTLNACGDGGVIVTDDSSLSERLRTLRNLGLATRDNCTVFSGNSRLDALQAAILLVKLKHLETWTQKRRANAACYKNGLSDIPDLIIPADKSYERAVYHTYVIQSERRDTLKSFLAERGVDTAVHYPIPIHLQTAALALGYPVGSFPVAERQAASVLSLPVSSELNPEDLDLVCGLIREFHSS